MKKLFLAIQAVFILFQAACGPNAYGSEPNPATACYDISYLSAQLQINNNLFRQLVLELSAPDIANSPKPTGFRPEQKLIQKLNAIKNPVANYDQYIKLLNLFSEIELSPAGLDMLTNTCINGQTLLIKKAAIDILIKIGDIYGPAFIKQHLFTLIKSGTLPYAIKRSIVYIANNTRHIKKQELQVLYEEVAREGENTFLITQAIKIWEENQKPLINTADKFTAFIKAIKTNTGSDRLNMIDLGTGDGEFVRRLKRYAWTQNIDITATDNSRDMIRSALYLNLVEVKKIDWRNIEFPENAFHLVTINFPSPNSGINSVKRGIQQAFGICKYGAGMVFYSIDCPNDGYDPKLILEALEQAGFTNIKIYKASEIPSSYPTTGTSSQLPDDDKYMITARKPNLSKHSHPDTRNLDANAPVNNSQTQIEQSI